MSKKIEDKAVKFAIKYEKRRTGKTPKSVSKTRCGYDLESRDRCIEVKGFCDVRYPSISLYKKLKKKLKGKERKYYVYVVFDIDNKSKLRILLPAVIWKNLEKDWRYIIRGRFYRNIQTEKLR